MDNGTSLFPTNHSVEAQAREWLIRLDGDTPLISDEASTLREWVERSPAHHRELMRISKFWHGANVLTELAVPIRKPFISFTFPRFAVSLICLILILSFFSWPILKPDTVGDGIYGTAIGQQQIFILRDSSTVLLNTDSQIEVDYSENSRKIRLLRGEAYFSVTHDSARPFEVYAGNKMVRAVGTAFSVHLKNENLKVTVTQGSVELAFDKSQTVTTEMSTNDLESEVLGTLKAGQTTNFKNVVKEINQLPESELARQLSWREGMLVFSGQSLEEVVAEVSRYAPINIEISDPELKKLPVGGRFKVGEIEALFDILQASFNVSITRLGDNHIQLDSISAH